jgi:hypothetical protein
MFVGAQVVNPQLRRPRFFGGGFTVEEEDVSLDALRVDLNLLGAKNETGRPKG